MLNRTINAERMHKLRVFVAIVEAGSMTHAAKGLQISRSVISAHLKQLETDLGVRLLERTTRTMAITDVGEQVYQHARHMLDAGQAALDAVDAHLGAVRGVLRVTMPVDLGGVVLPPVVATLRERHPALRIEALVGDTPLDIVRDRVDVAVRIGVPTDSGLVMRRLATTDEVFLAAPAFAARHGLGSDPRALQETPRVAHSLVDDPRPRLQSADGGEMLLALQPPVVSVGSSELVRRFVVDGNGTGVLPELFVRAELAAGTLVRVAAPWVRRRLDVYVLTPSRVTAPPVQAFIDVLRDELDA